MAQLSSPGVSVTVVDESFYTPGAPGTVPLIIVASQQDKHNNAGTGIAAGTLKANAGKVYLLTSQMDLGTTFGIPHFQTDANNNPVNAGELNEYGLQAVYSYLGVSNRAYVVRADLDTKQLVGSASIPHGLPAGGTWWLDLGATNFGVFEWNSNSIKVKGGQTFSHQAVTVITDTTLVDNTTYAPLDSVGAIGDYAMVSVTTLNILWYKKPQTDTAAGTWVKVGSPEWTQSQPTAAGSVANATLTATSGTPLAFTGYVDGTPGGTSWAGSGNKGTTLHIASGNYESMYSDSSLLINNWVISATGTALDGRTITGINGANGLIISGTDISLNGISGELTPAGDFLFVNGVSFGNVNNIDDLVSLINAANLGGSAGLITAANINGYFNLYSDGTATGYNGAPTGSISLFGSSVAKLGLLSKFYLPLSLTISPHYQPPEYGTFSHVGSANGAATASVWIKTTPVNLGADWIVKRYNETTASWIAQPVKMFSTTYEALALLDPLGGGINLPTDTIFVKYNDDEHPDTPYADFKLYRRAGTGKTAITSSIIHNETFVNGTTYQFYMSSTEIGSKTLAQGGMGGVVSFEAAGNAVVDSKALVAAILQTVAGTAVTATRNANNSITIIHPNGGDMFFYDDNTLSLLFTVGTTAYWNATAAVVDESYENGITWADADKYIASLWATTVGNPPVGFAKPSLSAPSTTPANGTLWYDTFLEDIDIMINNGTQWVGYLDTTAQAYNQQVYPVGGALLTDPMGPIISASMPTLQSNGSSLANGDLWINPQDTERFPTIYKYNSLTAKWVLIDNTDQLTSQGIVFADARWSDQGSIGSEQKGLGAPDSIESLLSSSFVDFDAPDPALYPKGTLLWNLRRSGFNVKKYVTDYVDIGEINKHYTAGNVYPEGQPMTFYYPDRWISEAPNDLNGVGQFGRHAQRAVVLKALLETINENQGIRQPDTVIFNLLSCPGYLETTSALISLNTDNGESAFIVADTPARLTPDATTLSNWGNNTAGAAVDGEFGLIENNAYSAVYYPWGYTSDLLGNYIVVPPSHIMLRTIALSDNVSYPWFAPAGVRRGGVTNASSVGYVEAATGEFKTVALNHGQRDTLAAVHVNPITYLAGTGLVVYGQKTRQLVASSLDRINVVRLVIYMRYQLNIIAKPFIFEPNDTITRNEIKQQIEKFLLELVGQRALYDYLVVCDGSNNTPSRIDANELHVDIAIEPVKAVEFIYIPLRLENTGAIKGLGK
jgi:hypothetical protein